jgi:hypothetical protein
MVNGSNDFGGVQVIAQSIEGGGVIGASSADITAGIGISGNNFSNVTVDIAADGSITGGGVVGASSASGTASVEITDGGNNFSDVEVVTAAGGYITGGGVIGASSASGIALIGNFSENMRSVTVSAGSYITGGGLIGVHSGSSGAFLGTVTDSAFRAAVTAGTYINGGGLIGVTGGVVSSTDALTGVGLIERTVFSGNEVTANNGQILGGAVYTYALAPATTGDLYGLDSGMIRDSQFTDNTFTSTISDPNPYVAAGVTAKVYGTVTIDTGLAGTDNLTLSATSGHSTTFKNNVINDAASTRYNSLYFGAVSKWETDSTGNITEQAGITASDAKLIISPAAGGVVALYDPIGVEQKGSYTFNMEVRGSGEFIWGGDNIFHLESPINGTIQLYSGSTTTLLNKALSDGKPFLLHGSKAPFVFTVDKGATLRVMGDDQMDVLGAKLSGNLYFNLDNDDGSGNLSALRRSSDSSSPVALLTFLDTYTNNIDLANLDGSRVSLGNFRAGDPLRAGDMFYLIATSSADDITNAPAPETVYATARQGLTRQYSFIIDDGSNDAVRPISDNQRYLVARLAGIRPAPEARIINEGRTAGLAFVANSATWLADHSYESSDLLIREKPGGWEYASFGGADGGYQRIGTGADLSIASSHLMLGRTAKRVREDGTLLYGGFVDAGFARYDAKGAFGGASVSGRGNLRSVGLGFMTRRVRPDGVRLEASLRGGVLENRFHSADLRDPAGNIARYDVNVPYFGAHLGIGREKQLNKHDSLDLLLRYYWARQNGKNITLPTDEEVRFSADESHRLRGGLRFTRAKNELRYWYVGAALEYEFDGKTRGVADGAYRLDEPDTRGFTGIAEIGVIHKPGPDSRFSAEYGLQFYGGKRRGLSGGVRLAWRF